MIQITHEIFPVLEWTSYRPGLEPENLKIAAVDQAGYDWMKGSRDLRTMTSLITSDYYAGADLAEKTRAKEVLPPGFHPHRHLYLTSSVFRVLDSHAPTRNRHFQNIHNVPSGSGTFLFRPQPDMPGGQYLYRILNPADTDTLRRMGELDKDTPKGARWFAVLYLAGDTLIGFESGFLPQQAGIGLYEGGYYEGGSERGQFISFAGIGLSMWHGGAWKEDIIKPAQEGNQTTQPVTIVRDGKTGK